ncbi:MAG: thioredoxin family protein [Flavobacterium sp.]|nr:thioredoxin family protein [Flavobacterium sp.]
MYQDLEKDNLAEIVATNEVVVVQYAASWCGNCKIMKPKFKMLASQNQNIPFVIADAEQFVESRKLAKVDNLPTFATFKNGVLLNQTQTSKLEALTELVNEVL